VASALRARGNDTDRGQDWRPSVTSSQESTAVQYVLRCATHVRPSVSFTVMSQDLGPQAVLDLLDPLCEFRPHFAAPWALEIETIGDAMFVACGVPDALPLQKSVR